MYELEWYMCNAVFTAVERKRRNDESKTIPWICGTAALSSLDPGALTKRPGRHCCLRSSSTLVSRRSRTQSSYRWLRPARRGSSVAGAGTDWEGVGSRGPRSAKCATDPVEAGWPATRGWRPGSPPAGPARWAGRAWRGRLRGLSRGRGGGCWPRCLRPGWRRRRKRTFSERKRKPMRRRTRTCWGGQESWQKTSKTRKRVENQSREKLRRGIRFICYNTNQPFFPFIPVGLGNNRYKTKSEKKCHWDSNSWPTKMAKDVLGLVFGIYQKNLLRHRSIRTLPFFPTLFGDRCSSFDFSPRVVFTIQTMKKKQPKRKHDQDK